MQATPAPQAAPLLRLEVEACLRACARELHDRYGVQELSLFGSVARDEAGAGSDVDLLVAFRSPPGFDGYMKLKWRLEGLLGRRVDLVMDGALIPDARRVIEAEAVRVA